MLLAQFHHEQWTFTGVVVAIVIVAAILGVMFVALNRFGIKIPDWVIQIFWIVVVAFVAIMAIKFLASMW